MFLHSVLSYIANNLNLTTDYLRPTSEIVTEALNFISLTTNENMGSGLPHYWSLVVEWHFYIIVMLFLPLVRSNRGLKIALAILFISAFINLYPFFTDSNFSTVYRIFEFIIGVCIALIPYKFNFNNRLILTITLFTLIIFLWISPTIFLYEAGNFSRSITIYGAISGCIVYIASLNQNLLANIPFIGRALLGIGTISYSIYICHITIWNTFQTIIVWYGSAPPLILHVFLLMLFLFATSILLYKYIEQPMRKVGILLAKKL